MHNLMLNSFTLTGKSREHLQHLPCPFSENYFLHSGVINAFQSLQKSAVENGFNLQPASTFRDFQRQQLIWNEKFSGLRKVHNDQGKQIDLTNYSEWEKCKAILRWSALPGASRHHWGTEIDVFDPNLLPEDQKLQLEPWEYEKGGYFFEFSQWLQENLSYFDFELPFLTLPDQIKIGREPWHISYIPIASKFKQQFTADILIEAWQNEEIMGKEILIEKMPIIFEQFLV